MEKDPTSQIALILKNNSHWKWLGPGNLLGSAEDEYFGLKVFIKYILQNHSELKKGAPNKSSTSLCQNFIDHIKTTEEGEKNEQKKAKYSNMRDIAQKMLDKEKKGEMQDEIFMTYADVFFQFQKLGVAPNEMSMVNKFLSSFDQAQKLAPSIKEEIEKITSGGLLGGTRTKPQDSARPDTAPHSPGLGGPTQRREITSETGGGDGGREPVETEEKQEKEIPDKDRKEKEEEEEEEEDLQDVKAQPPIQGAETKADKPEEDADRPEEEETEDEEVPEGLVSGPRSYQASEPKDALDETEEAKADEPQLSNLRGESPPLTTEGEAQVKKETRQVKREAELRAPTEEKGGARLQEQVIASKHGRKKRKKKKIRQQQETGERGRGGIDPEQAQALQAALMQKQKRKREKSGGKKLAEIMGKSIGVGGGCMALAKIFGGKPTTGTLFTLIKILFL